MILKLPRTGSTYLVHLLNAHEQVSVVPEYPNRYRNGLFALWHRFGDLSFGGESLEDRRHAFAVERIGRYLRRGRGTAYRGISMNPLKEGFGADELRRMLNRDSRVITLIRNNHLKQYLSFLNVQHEARAGNRVPYHPYQAAADNSSRKFTLTNVTAQVERLRVMRRELERLASQLPCPHLALGYEDDLNRADKSGLFARLADFLGIESCENWRSYRPGKTCDGEFYKLLPDHLPDVIANYEAVRGVEALQPYLEP